MMRDLQRILRAQALLRSCLRPRPIWRVDLHGTTFFLTDSGVTRCDSFEGGR